MAFSVELSYTFILKRDPAEGRLYNFIKMKYVVWFYGISNSDFYVAFLSKLCVS